MRHQISFLWVLLSAALLLGLVAAFPALDAEAGALNLPRTGVGVLADGFTHFDRNPLFGPPFQGVAVPPGPPFFERLPGSGPGPFAGSGVVANPLVTPALASCAFFRAVGLGSGEICGFTDALASPAPYHFELELRNPGLLPTPGYNVLFFTPEGISGGQVRPMFGLESYFFDVLTNDALIGDVGLRSWWIFSTLPFTLDATSSITEGGVYPLPLFPCPVNAAIACGGVAGFSEPTSEIFVGPVDPALDSFFFTRPEDFAPLMTGGAQVELVPAPPALTLTALGAALLGLGVGLRRRAQD